MVHGVTLTLTAPAAAPISAEYALAFSSLNMTNLSKLDFHGKTVLNE